MAGEVPKDPTAEFAKELARQLPVKVVYEDAVAPAAKQTGQLLEDLTKVLQLALLPVQYLAALQDRFRRFLDRSIRRIPEENQISPAPQIIGPVLEGIRYEPEGTPIDEMFSELLSRSMDRERVNEAHPSYPFIIRQLSSDEAKIIKLLKDRQFDFVRTSDLDRNTNLFHGGKIEVDELPRDDLMFPGNVDFYFQHLNQLGLAGIFQVGNQEPLTEPHKDAPSMKRQVGVRIRSKYRLSDLGQRFARACIRENA